MMLKWGGKPRAEVKARAGAITELQMLSVRPRGARRRPPSDPPITHTRATMRTHRAGRQSRHQPGTSHHDRRAPHGSHPLSYPFPLPPTPHTCPPVPLHAVPGRERTVARNTEKRDTPVVPKVTQTNQLPDVIPMLLRKRDTNLTGNRHNILHTVIAIPLSHFRRARKKSSRPKVT